MAAGRKDYDYERNTGAEAEKREGISGICQGGDADPQSVAADRKSVPDGRNHLLYRAVYPQYSHKSWPRQADLRQLVLDASGTFVRCPDGLWNLSENRQMGRGRCAGADHGVCKFRGSSGDRVQDRGTGIRNRLQNIYHRRTGHPLRYPHKLGAGAYILGAENV